MIITGNISGIKIFFFNNIVRKFTNKNMSKIKLKSEKKNGNFGVKWLKSKVIKSIL